MKKTIVFVVAAFATGTAVAGPSAASQTEFQEGYLCAISRVSITAGRRGDETALAFNLTTGPECTGEWLETNYACGSGPRAGVNLGACSKTATFSMTEHCGSRQ